MVEDLLLEAGLFDLEAEIHVGGGEALKLKTPEASLTRTCFSPVAGLVSVRLAPETTAPVGSVTTP